MPQEPLSNIKALAVMHFSLFMGQIMFGAIAFYLVYSKSFTPISGNEELLITVSSGLIGFAVATIMASFIMYRKKLEKIKTSVAAVSDKLTAYRAASIIRWAMLEVPTLLIIICYLFTGQQLLLMIAGIILLLFMYTKPGIAKAAAELDIDEKEIK